MKYLQRLLLLCALAIAIPGWAATTTTTFAVSGTVVPTCTVSAGPLSFGASIANPIAANIDASNTLTATCSSGTAYTVALNVGIGAGATFAVRKMTGPAANTMNYSLFTTAARTTVWGDGTAGTGTVAGTGTGAGQAIPVFGRITPQTVGATGAYSDTITVTLTF